MNKWISVCIVEDGKEIRERVKQIIEDSDDFLCLNAFDNGGKF